MPINPIETLRQYIAESRQTEAIELLLKEWKGKDEALYDLSLQIKERYNFLQKELAQGVISQTDAELERAKITDALLFLTNRLNNPKAEAPRHLQGFLPAETIQKRTMVQWIVPSVISLLILTLGYFAIKNFMQPAAFDLKVYVHQAKNQGIPITTGKIQVRIGEKPLTAQTLGADGRVIFMDIPYAYLQDSLHFIPVEMPYQVASQSAWTAAQSKNVEVGLEPVTQWTTWRGKVTNAKGNPISGAKLEVESGLAMGETDEQGNFAIKVPKTAGEQVQVMIYYQNKLLRNSIFTLTEAIPSQITVE